MLRKCCIEWKGISAMRFYSKHNFEHTQIQTRTQTYVIDMSDRWTMFFTVENGSRCEMVYDWHQLVVRCTVMVLNLLRWNLRSNHVEVEPVRSEPHAALYGTHKQTRQLMSLIAIRKENRKKKREASWRLDCIISANCFDRQLAFSGIPTSPRFNQNIMHFKVLH